MKIVNKKTLIIIFSFIIIILIFIGVNAGKTNSSLNNQEVYANQKPDELSFIMAGKVDAIESADISSKTSGKIAELNVDVGSVVRKGDVLARIDMKEVPAQVNQAQSTIDIANVNLNNAQNSYNRALELYQAGQWQKKPWKVQRNS
ncbi:efflux RND transporter periplasmic adaptor subunit [Aminipila terrae]|uniref:Biotin/lipoyl-binding protein n=1 Tax=Aminipila terrae TaxID=2697030 RepID=A0A6P1MPP1_9FIRM|nr:biotin/lipoyl-binding protein [Aminipila terrae]QHI72965.1 biotin/lipoyl-binding protein [Aminipila terrae]